MAARIEKVSYYVSPDLRLDKEMPEDWEKLNLEDVKKLSKT
ncbi:MAG: hypothetical protein P8168_02985 [Deltaproteobacteria bacterium]|jgi:hypothetical protein